MINEEAKQKLIMKELCKDLFEFLKEKQLKENLSTDNILGGLQLLHSYICLTQGVTKENYLLGIKHYTEIFSQAWEDV